MPNSTANSDVAVALASVDNLSSLTLRLNSLTETAGGSVLDIGGALTVQTLSGDGSTVLFADGYGATGPIRI